MAETPAIPSKRLEIEAANRRLIRLILTTLGESFSERGAKYSDALMAEVADLCGPPHEEPMELVLAKMLHWSLRLQGLQILRIADLTGEDANELIERSLFHESELAGYVPDDLSDLD